MSEYALFLLLPPTETTAQESGEDCRDCVLQITLLATSKVSTYRLHNKIQTPLWVWISLALGSALLRPYPGLDFCSYAICKCMCMQMHCRSALTDSHAALASLAIAATGSGCVVRWRREEASDKLQGGSTYPWIGPGMKSDRHVHVLGACPDTDQRLMELTFLAGDWLRWL